MSTSLREKFPEDQLQILVAKSNAGSFTYDGVDTGGERVANEVEQKLEELARDGHEIKKISFIGYSLGGVISRYAIGLLYHRGLFERIQPVNFTTFATPHLGARSPKMDILVTYGMSWLVTYFPRVGDSYLESTNSETRSVCPRCSGRPRIHLHSCPCTVSRTKPLCKRSQRPNRLLLHSFNFSD